MYEYCVFILIIIMSLYDTCYYKDDSDDDD